MNADWSAMHPKYVPLGSNDLWHELIVDDKFQGLVVDLDGRVFWTVVGCTDVFTADSVEEAKLRLLWEVRTR